MKVDVIVTICMVVLVYEAFENNVDAAQVNIDLSKFQNGTLTVPENRRQDEIPVTFTETVRNNQVTVTCTLINTKSGFRETKVRFENITVPVGSTGTNVEFSIISPGSAVTISCTGKSDGNNPQFSGSASTGNVGLLRVTKAPVVFVQIDTLLVPPYVKSSNIEVYFREEIAGFPAIVQCSTLEASSGASSPLQLQFKRTVAQVGQSKIQVPFSILSHGAAVKVACQAQTSNIVFVSASSVIAFSRTVEWSAESATVITATPSVSVTPSVGSGRSARKRRSFIESSQNVTSFQYLFNTSAGPPVAVSLGPPRLRIIPQGGVLRGTEFTVYRAVLILDNPADKDLVVTCSLKLLEVGADLNTSVVCPTPDPNSDTVSLANGTIKLKLKEKELKFKDKDMFKPLELQLSGGTTDRVRDLVQVTCCPDESDAYKEESGVAFVWLDLFRVQPVDWNNIESEKRKSTRVADIDLSCPCNLKENSCDVGCCCDTKDCSSSERESVTCIPGFFGGAESERPFEFSCEATWPDVSDLSPVLCVTTNNSPFFGYFFNFTSPPSAQTPETFNKLSSEKETFDYSEHEERASDLSGEPYKAGSIIKTAVNFQNIQYLGALSLPMSVVSGLCSPTVPVRFGENSQSRCVLPLDESLCGSTSFSAHNYLLSRDLSPSLAILPAAVLQDGMFISTLPALPNLAQTEVRYFCTADSNGYVAMSTGDSVPVGSLDSTESSLFSAGSKIQTSAQLTRCSFDDGETYPPMPVFNESLRICSFAVLNVKYELTWRGQQVLKVRADVVLGDVAIPKTDDSRDKTLATSESLVGTVTQQFSVTFVHSPLKVQNNSDPEVPFTRSGNPGYVRGLSVLSRKVEENSGKNLSQVSSGQLLTWSPGPDGLCASSSQSPVLYGQDSTSGCLLKLALRDLRNCSQLRQLVWTNQERLIQATHVGRAGNANLDLVEDWVPIFKEALKNSSAAENSSFVNVGTCPDIPAMLRVEFLISEAGKYKGVAQMEVVGVKVTYDYTTWKFNCVSGFGVSCSGPGPTASNDTVTPSSGNASVTPSSASVIKASRTMNLVTVSSVPSPPVGVNVTNNTEREYGTRFQYFVVTSSVTFTKVPSTDPPRVKRSKDTTGICYRDVCRHELFFPLTAAYQGESRDLVVVYSLLLIFFALCTLAMTKPWG